MSPKMAHFYPKTNDEFKCNSSSVCKLVIAGIEAESKGWTHDSPSGGRSKCYRVLTRISTGDGRRGFRTYVYNAVTKTPVPLGAADASDVDEAIKLIAVENAVECKST